MLPWHLVLGLLGSMAAYNQIQTAAAVASAATTAATAGAVAGATATAATTNPRGLLEVIRLPLRVANAPFYYLLGGHAADRRLKTLELANANLAEAQQAFIDTISDQKLVFEPLQVCLSQDYIAKIKASLRAGGGSINFANPAESPVFSVGKFEDPFKEVYTVIVLNEVGEKLIIGILVAVAAGSFLYILVYSFRRIIRYSFRFYKIAKRVVSEENLKEKRKNFEKSYFDKLENPEPSAPPIPTNYLTS